MQSCGPVRVRHQLGTRPVSGVRILPAMSAQVDKVVSELRRRILSGELLAGQRLVELAFTKALDVSRTPFRIALAELEKEGLLERLPKRGFRVRSFSMQQITDAVDVRGELEGMAARLVAQRGPDAALLAELDACVAWGDRIIAQAQRTSRPIDGPQWSEMNLRFHGLIVQASGNTALAPTLGFVSRIPMAGAGALTVQGVMPELEMRFIQRAQSDHADCVRALRDRCGTRAQAIMREHAFRSRENKLVLIERMSSLHEAERAARGRIEQDALGALIEMESAQLALPPTGAVAGQGR